MRKHPLLNLSLSFIALLSMTIILYGCSATNFYTSDDEYISNNNNGGLVWNINIPEYLTNDSVVLTPIIESLGGLDYNEAYQFVTEDGYYVIITGHRPIFDMSEVLAFYPDVLLPERVGDFEFRDFFTLGTNDEATVGNRRFVRINENIYEPLPLGEIFVRDTAIRGLIASYESSLGEIVQLHVTGSYRCISCDEHFQCTFLPSYPGVHFMGLDGFGEADLEERRYWGVSYISEHFRLTASVSMADPTVYTYFGMYRVYSPLIMNLEELIELAEIFELAEFVNRNHLILQHRNEEFTEVWIS